MPTTLLKTVAIIGLLSTAITGGIVIGTDRSRINYLDKIIVDLRGDLNDHIKKYEQLENTVVSIDKNVYGITVHLGIKNAIKPEISK